MGIGVSGRDPALDNKSLLSLDGIGFGGEFGSGQRATHMGGPDGDGRTPSASAQPTGQFAVPRPAGSIPGQGAPQLKVGGGGEQAKAAFRMMGFNV